MRNKYATKCSACGGRVAAGQGTLIKKGKKWSCKHDDCSRQAVNEITFSSGVTVYQNANGRCEDAPCCGCCTC